MLRHVTTAAAGHYVAIISDKLTSSDARVSLKSDRGELKEIFSLRCLLGPDAFQTLLALARISAQRCPDNESSFVEKMKLLSIIPKG